MYQVVLDTNVLIAGLRSRRGASFKLLSLIGTGVFEINLSVPLVLEYEYAAKREARHLGLTDTDIDDIIDYLCLVGNPHKIHFLWRPILKDPSDDMLLELAVAAEADCIVTFNTRHFEAVESFGIDVLTPRQFLQKIGVTK